MQSAITKITPEIEKIIRASKIDGTSLILPPSLDSKVYKNVNEVLENAGGKWNRKAKAHIFPGDPIDLLLPKLEKGEIVDQKKLYQSYYTPQEVAEYVIDLTDVEGFSVLEPSGGDGALIKAAMKAGALAVDTIELNPELEATLSKLDAGRVLIGDFMDLKPNDKIAFLPQYERIIMNPPYTKNQDVAHVLHAVRFLKPDGELVAIMLGNPDRSVFKKLTNKLDVLGWKHRLEQLPTASFKYSGTMVNTMVLIVGYHTQPQ